LQTPVSDLDSDPLARSRLHARDFDAQLQQRSRDAAIGGRNDLEMRNLVAQYGEVLKVTLPRLRGCVEELGQAGNPVTLRPEISGKAAMLGWLSDVFELGAIPGVIPYIDFAHLHARLGDGAMNTYSEWISALDLYRKFLGDPAL
jgi:hypothetical protein